ncbi:hypothetical protein LCGC14_1678960 [marine sediment metagenome]|uniref:Uncharacterized protein n=1 Tax=marine sediment metagenome TaxID=412755 RepID=A0A0F9KP80_9ZZZZ
MSSNKGSQNKSPRQEAREFVGRGELRDNLQGKLSDEALEKIIDACSFVLKV